MSVECGRSVTCRGFPRCHAISRLPLESRRSQMFAGAASLLAWRNLTESLEHPHLHPLERLVLRQLARTERHQVAALDADHDAARVSVGWRDERPIVMAPRGDREPL